MSHSVAPLVLGLRGPTLAEDEIAFIKQVRPAAFLLFSRNIQSALQVRELTAELAELSPFNGPLIGVDQEGGRVQRLAFSGALPSAAVFGKWLDADAPTALEATRLWAFLLAVQLREVGATWALAPCLDLSYPETHAIIGDRAFHSDPHKVAELGQAHLAGTRRGGCMPCLKHAPGHGRAMADSHRELPTVDATAEALEADAAPFRELASHSPFIMTAHIYYPRLMAQHQPVTFDAELIAKMREEWNFKGLMVADDLGMQALEGDYPTRANQALAAGCDLVITSFSKIAEGMAGTVFDEETYRAFTETYNCPPLGERAAAFLSRFKLGPMPEKEQVEEARARFHKLWADGPARMGYKLAS